MRPLKLVVEGLRSFRGAVEVDFEGRDHIAIIGDTGAGKSSLLEAMTWVLYGRTSWSGQPNQELMNATSSVLRVVLRFVVNRQTWEVVRVCKRTGDGDVGAVKAGMKRFDSGTEPIEQIEGGKNVVGRVTALIGLDADAFMRAVILPQGQFAQLLVEDRGTDRAKILRQIWRIDGLHAIRESARSAREALVVPRSRVEQALDGEPEDPSAHLAELRVAAKRATKLAYAASIALDEVNLCCDQIAAASEVTGRATEASEAVRFDVEPHRVRSAALQTRSATLSAEHDGVTQKRTKAAAGLVLIPSDDDGLTEVDVARANSTIAQIEAQLTKLVSDALRVRQVSAVAKEADKHARAARSKAAKARATSDTSHAQRDRLERALLAASNRVGDVRARLTNVRSLEGQADEVKSRVAAERDNVGQVERNIEAARNDVETTRAALAIAQDALTQAQRTHAAAHASEGLSSGDPCPVCTQTLPKKWRAPVAGQLADLEKVVVEAGRAHSDAGQRVAKHETSLDLGQRGLDALAERARNLELEVSEAWTQLIALIGTPPTGAGGADSTPDAAIVAPLDDAVSAARSALNEHDTTGRQYETLAAEAQTGAALAEQTAANQRTRAEELAEAVQTGAASIAAAVATLPDALEVNLELAKEPASIESVETSSLDRARTALTARTAVLAERKVVQDKLRAEIASLDDALGRLAAAKKSEVDTPLSSAIEQLDSWRDAIRNAATLAGMTALALPTLTNVTPDELRSRVDALDRHAAAVQQRAEALRGEAQAEVERAHVALGAHATALGLVPSGMPSVSRLTGDDDPSPNYESGKLNAFDASEVASAAKANHDELAYSARTATEAVERFSLRVEPLERLRVVRDALVDKERAVSDLALALNDGAFPKWLTLRRSKSLLVHASRLLKDMTAQRYAFADLDDENEDWKVIDLDTGLPRSPASLSGGEKFVASLALALGMVEMMARSGGRLESLWLDEGFGALDRSNLDAAVEALATVASSGRLVAVISHVRAVAEQVEHVLAVSNSATGSAARWLTSKERAQVADADADDATNAMSGLLD